MGQQQQRGAVFTALLYANIAAAQLMNMIYVSRAHDAAHRATDSAEIDLASSLYHDYVSLHIQERRGGFGEKKAESRQKGALQRKETGYWRK